MGFGELWAVGISSTIPGESVSSNSGKSLLWMMLRGKKGLEISDAVSTRKWQMLLET